MKVFFITEDLRNDLIAFLATRPYSDVAKGITRLEALHEVPQQVPFQIVDGQALPDPRAVPLQLVNDKQPKGN